MGPKSKRKKKKKHSFTYSSEVLTSRTCLQHFVVGTSTIRTCLKPNIDVQIESQTLTTRLELVYMFATSKSAEALPPTRLKDRHRRWDVSLLRAITTTGSSPVDNFVFKPLAARLL
ncbi:hypothetical protein DY000_02035895 [Brassica cretica]|uniref:Uncharacterized protein n=1 Tax=Brassica cretica TaxID=69181 RepID=A0ABQ7DS57_BRACR|nr:hypothetical protein DY000_02035895 [Brassica cretica]